MRVTDDDRERTARMQAESGRSAAATSMSHDEFLTALGLRVHVIRRRRIVESGVSTQLINKTNQFNLTTRRRSEAEVAALAADPESTVLAFAVDDRFGEYGIVGVTISRQPASHGWELDTVLMSCRVLGRGVETAMLAETVARVRADRPSPVIARDVPPTATATRWSPTLLPDHGFVATPRRRTIDARPTSRHSCSLPKRRSTSPHTSPCVAP